MRRTSLSTFSARSLNCLVNDASFLRAIDDFLRGRGVFASDAPLSGRLLWLLILLIACGLFYGAVMGTYSGLPPSDSINCSTPA